MTPAESGSRPTASSLRDRLVKCIVRMADVQRRIVETLYGILGPRAAYGITRAAARVIYHLLTPFRLQSEAQCRAALGNLFGEAEIVRAAEQSYIHRALNLTDLMLARRLLNRHTFVRYGGAIHARHLSRLTAAQRRGQPAVLVTAYYGPFDLLPVFLGYNGVRAAVVYRPHPNAGFDAWRTRIRARSGCEMVPVSRAPQRLAEILERGGTVALLADHHLEERGVPVRFLGIPTTAPRSIGLLAARYRADVVVAGIRRRAEPFHSQIEVLEVLDHSEWADEPDPVTTITKRYVQALERMIRADPTQYLWGYARWGEGFARKLARRASVSG